MATKKAVDAIEVTFEGGPQDGFKMRVKNPPEKTMRLAYPAWGTYEYAGSHVYKHIED